MAKVTELVAKLAAPAVEAAGCELWDVEYVREAGIWYLRLYIDKEGGVKRPGDFARFMGSPVLVKLYKGRDGRKEFAGELSGYEDGAVTITMGGETVTFQANEVALCRLRVEF